MKALRFILWNVGIKVCDVIGGPLNRWALWVERRTGREWPWWLLGCALHPSSLLPPHDEIPESWWSRAGWRK